MPSRRTTSRSPISIDSAMRGSTDPARAAPGAERHAPWRGNLRCSRILPITAAPQYTQTSVSKQAMIFARCVRSAPSSCRSPASHALQGCVSRARSAPERGGSGLIPRCSGPRLPVAAARQSNTRISTPVNAIVANQVSRLNPCAHCSNHPIGGRFGDRTWIQSTRSEIDTWEMVRACAYT